MKKTIKLLVAIAIVAIAGFLAFNFANGQAYSGPTVQTKNISGITINSASFSGLLVDSGNAANTDVWFEYWQRDGGNRQETTKTFINSVIKSTQSYQGYSFARNVNTLTPGKEYCFRAVAQNSLSKSYGEEKCFTTANTANLGNPIVKTLNPSNVSNNRAVLNGRVESLGNPSVANVKFEWYRQAQPSNKKQSAFKQIYLVGDFSQEITDLMPDNLYCYRTVTSYTYVGQATYSGSPGYYMPYPYACSGNDCARYPQPNTYYQPGYSYYNSGVQNYNIYGEEKCFTTGQGNTNNDYYKASLGTSRAENVDQNSVTLVANLTNLGNDNEVDVWFEYGKTSSYGNSTTRRTRTATGNVYFDITGLTANTRYYARALAQNDAGTTYGTEFSFCTDDNGNYEDEKPSVTTNSATNIDNDRATLNARLEDIGSDSDASVWFEYGRTTSYGNQTSQVTKYSTGDFSKEITGLEEDTTYHFRAIARNDAGTTYGNDRTFTTDYDGNNSDSEEPYVVTNSATDINRYSATLNGNLEEIGDDNDAEVWFEYGKTSSFGNNTNHKIKSTSGTFSSYIDDLSSDTTYYFRAVARNSYGTVYGSARSFVTNYNGNDDNDNQKPSVITYSATNINDDSATLRGYINDLGDDSNIEVWFEWGRTESFGNYTSQRTRTWQGEFTANISGLTSNRTYYYRIVARNDHGISYGNTRSFIADDNTYGVDGDNDYTSNGLTLGFWAANVTGGENTWSKLVRGEGSNQIAFRFDVKNTTSQTQKNVITQVLLSPYIKYTGNLKINNVSASGDITNLNLGDIYAGQTKTVTFYGTVDPIDRFVYGQSQLINVVTTRNRTPQLTDTNKIYIWRANIAGIATGPSSLATGLGSDLIDYLLLPLIVALILTFVFRKQLKELMAGWDQKLIHAVKKNSDRSLEKKIQEIKKG